MAGLEENLNGAPTGERGDRLTLNHLGILLETPGDYEQATWLHGQSLPYSVSLSPKLCIIEAHRGLGAALAQGNARWRCHTSNGVFRWPAT